jgi:ribonucleoside-diphosphate reductase alpha chain
MKMVLDGGNADSLTTNDDSLTSLSHLIFLDRYSRKDQDRSKLEPGQRVVVCVDIDTRQRELAVIKKVEKSQLSGGITVEVAIEEDGRLVTVPVDQVDRPVETFDEAIVRIAKAVGDAETTDKAKAAWGSRFQSILGNFSFVPAGRIWAGAGVDEKLTPYNCYVLPPPTDSRHGIIATLDRMTEIMSRGGGVGIPLMSLRPKYANVRSVNGRSSGSVAWSEIYSFGTGLIEQGGSRRGALMLIQYDWHPDVLDFVTAKTNEKRINNANVSVAVSDALMKAVEADADWDLIFPDTSHPSYDEVWDGDIEKWKAAGLPTKVYNTIKARELWELITHSAWKSAEPGLFFSDHYNKMSNSYYYDEGRIFCTNPCGEQGIPGNSVCNLGHLNLARFLEGDGMHEPARVNWALLKTTVRTAVRFMDNVIDIAFTPFAENDTQQKGERRVGLGTMGLGEMLIRMHIRYGANDECLSFLDELYGTIAHEAYMASSEIAAEKGSFEWFDAEKVLESGFMKGMPADVRESVKKNGLRGVTNLTQAPTGTVGTMMNTSTGIEQFPWWEWERMGRLGKHRERAGVYDEYMRAHPDVARTREAMPLREQFMTSAHLPDHFVTATEMSPKDHALTQAAIQRWVDSSISKTCNLPEHYTVEDVSDFYKTLYDSGCKGGTVYRDKCREEQVLNVPDEEKAPVPQPAMREVPEGVYDMKAISVHTPVGKMNIKVGIHEDGSIFESWFDISKAGTTVNADREALARLVSLILRMDSPLDPKARMNLVIDQLKGIGGRESHGFGPNRVDSIPDGIAKGLQKLLSAVETAQKAKQVVEVVELPGASEPASQGSNGKGNGNGNGSHRQALLGLDICPTCHEAAMYRSEGCSKCANCAFSRC